MRKSVQGLGGGGGYGGGSGGGYGGGRGGGIYGGVGSYGGEEVFTSPGFGRLTGAKVGSLYVKFTIIYENNHGK